MLVGIWSRQAAWRAKVFVVAVNLQRSHFRPFFFCNTLRSCRERHRSCLVVAGLSKSQRAKRDFLFSPHTSLGATYSFSASFFTTKKVLLFTLLLQLHLLSPFFFFISLSFLLHTFPIPSISLIILSRILSKSRGLIFLSLFSESWSYIRL